MDSPACGTVPLPCKSLKYMEETSKLLKADRVNVIHVEGKFITCERVNIQKSMKLVGISGKPVVNCSHSCKRFLEISLRDPLYDMERPIVMIQNIEFINKGCTDYLIAIIKVPSILFLDISVRESKPPAIIINPLYFPFIHGKYQPMNITIRKSTFLSAYGIQVHKSATVITIDSCQFLGGGTEVPVTGIKVVDMIADYRPRTKLFIMSTIFMRLNTAIYISSKSTLEVLLVFVRNCTFKYNDATRYNKLTLTYPFGGAFFFNGEFSTTGEERVKVVFINVNFQNNTSLKGGAVAIFHDGRPHRSRLQIGFKNCTFISNKAIDGGAVAAVHNHKNSADAIYIYNSVFVNNVAKNTIDKKQKTVSKFNIISHAQGGAVSCFSFKLIMSETTLINNAADVYGGSIFDDYCFVILRNSTIRINDKMSSDAVEGQVIYSRGIQIMNNVTIKVEKTFLRSSRDSYIGTVTKTVVVPHILHLICHLSNDIEIKATLTLTEATRQTKSGNILLFRCLPCPENFYTIDSGSAFISNATNRKINNAQCLPCPYGGECSSSIKAKPNFWGYKSGDQTIKFLLCPAKYCCQGENCKTYSSCNENREGRVCGKCRDGFVNGLLSGECIQKSRCGSPLIWVVISLGGLSYVLLLMYLPEIVKFVKFILWWKKKKNSISSNETKEDTYTMAGLIKVIFFISQIEPLLKAEQNTDIATSNGQSLLQVTKYLRSVITAILNFHVILSCPFKTLTTVMKTIILAAFPLVSLLILALLLILFWVVKFVKSKLLKAISNNFNEKKSVFLARSISCFVNLILLTYGTIAKTALALLNCVKINEARVLYIDGTVICYNPWQYILAAFACVFVFPLPMGFALSIKKLKEGKLSVVEFLFRLCFPILQIFDTVILRIRDCMSQKKSTNCKASSHVLFQRNRKHYIQGSESCIHEFSECSVPEEACNDTLQETGPILEDSRTSLKQLSCTHDSEMCVRGPVAGQKTGESHPQDLEAHHHTSTQAQAQHIDNRLQIQSHTTSAKALLEVLERPFSNKEKNCQVNWESILIARRLVITLIFTFTPYPTLRVVIMLIICWIMILHTCYASPYASKVVNRCEIAALVVLAILCLVNSLITFNHELNTHLTGYLKLLPKIYFWTETILADIIPLTFFAAIIILIVFKLFFFMCKFVCYKIWIFLPSFKRGKEGNGDYTYHPIET